MACFCPCQDYDNDIEMISPDASTTSTSTDVSTTSTSSACDMAKVTIGVDQFYHFLALEWDMSPFSTQQAMNIYMRCRSLVESAGVDHNELVVACGGLAFKFYEAEETGGRWIRPGRIYRFKNLAALEFMLLRHLDYKL